MLRILSLIIAVVLVIWGILFLTGYNASPEYENSISFTVANSPMLTWQQMLDIKDTPNRKSDVKSIEILEEYGKLIAWKENLKNGGHRTYRMNKRIENQELVLELTESTEGLTGVWTFTFQKEDADTFISISEKSKLTNTLSRGYHTILGREYNLLVWQKYIKVGLVQALLNTP
ncbi:MAG: putative signal peptide protein [Candidatus Parcubacteria bacterium]|jgi:hypothetical protein